MTLPKKIRIREVGPREGFQILKTVYSTSDKARLINMLSQSGLKEIEITSFVRKDKVPQMADAEELSNLIQKKPGVRYTALYLNPEGFQRAEGTGRLDNQCWISAACSDTFLAKNANTSLSKIIDSIPLWLSTFSQYGKSLHGLVLSTSFGCHYEGAINPEKITKVLRAIDEALSRQSAKLKEVSLADTIGIAAPENIESAILAIRKEFPDLYISLHLHNTNGLGMANALCGLQHGIDCFDSSIGGLGGCPFTEGASGNISTEDLVYMCQKMGVETGVDLKTLSKICEHLQTNLKIKLNSEYKYEA